MKRRVTRHGRILGCYAPVPVVEAIQTWIAQNPERDISTFIREAAREKLAREGIHFEEAGTVKGARP
jgi:hypothetical protein